MTYLKFVFTALLLCFQLIASTSYALHAVSNLKAVFLPVYQSNGDLLIATRVFDLDHTPSFLLVDPKTLTTSVRPIQAMATHHKPLTRKSGYFTHWLITSTPYYQRLNLETAPPYPLENKGITHASQPVDGNVLSIDLCPSSKPFERQFFHNLVQKARQNHKPLPIAVAVSGLWILEHPSEFQWLVKQQKSGYFDITWVNHSFSHVFYKDLPYSENFLLAPDTHIDSEILLTEKTLIEHGQVPSIFFRFPGLVSNKKLLMTLKHYGLIPLSADAWLAKGEQIHPGSIILVHGNSNEPLGIKRLSDQLDKLKLVDLKAVL